MTRAALLLSVLSLLLAAVAFLVAVRGENSNRVTITTERGTSVPATQQVHAALVIYGPQGQFIKETQVIDDWLWNIYTDDSRERVSKITTKGNRDVVSDVRSFGELVQVKRGDGSYANIRIPGLKTLEYSKGRTWAVKLDDTRVDIGPAPPEWESVRQPDGTSSIVVRGPEGPPGKDGVAGVAGKDGAPGKDGAAGEIGKGGKDGVDGKDGVARDGRDGVAGAQGATGAVGPAGERGARGESVVGPVGEPGKDGKTGVGLTWRGAWGTYADYAPMDLVYFDGSTWICVAPVLSALAGGAAANIRPGDDADHWAIFAAGAVPKTMTTLERVRGDWPEGTIAHDVDKNALFIRRNGTWRQL